MVTKAFSVEDGNLGSRSLITSRSKLYKDLDLSFEAKPTSGDIYKKEDAAAVKQSVKNILLTNYGEKPFQPEFGGNLVALLFELGTDITARDIEIAIENAINVYEPRARLRNIDVNLNLDRNYVKVNVEFQVVNTEEIVSVSTNISRLR